MTDAISFIVPDADLIHFPAEASSAEPAVGRAQNFCVEWIDTTASRTVQSDHELLLLLPGAGGCIDHADGSLRVAGRSVCILPAGRCTITLEAPAIGILIASQRHDLSSGDYLNERHHDPRLVSSTPAFRRREAGSLPAVISIDDIAAPADNPRLKMFQTDTLSINWVEYDGPRDRSRLSPHQHADFEQGSLAIAGNYIHHLRTPWTRNANQWREDLHWEAGARSLLVIPAGMVHTTEGVGPGYHLLIDIFSPPRRDFIAKQWIANSADYVDPLVTGD